MHVHSADGSTFLFEMTKPQAFLEEGRPNKKNNNKMSSDMGSALLLTKKNSDFKLL